LLFFALRFFGCARDREAKGDGAIEMLTVSNQMKRVYFELRDALGDGDHFPVSFAEMKSRSVNRHLFILPGSGSKIGNMESVEDWTDFIYVGNNTELVPDVALIISPPENHGGEYGYVVEVDGVFVKLPAG
jgi:hypothetical protein